MRGLAIAVVVLLASCTQTQDFHRDGDPAATCEANTRSDAANCGACGHSCLGGTCTNAICDPVTLAVATTPSYAAPIAIDDGSVYWDDGSGFHRVAKSGGASETVARPRFDTPGAGPVAAEYAWLDQIIVDGSDLFLRSYTAGRIWRLSPGAAPVVVIQDPALDSISSFDVDATSIVWTRWGGGMFVCPREGCGANAPANIEEPLDVYFAKLVGDRIYYTAGYGADTTLRSVPRTGGASADVLAGEIGYADGLAIDGASAFVLGSQTGVLRVPLGGGAPVRNIVTGARLHVASGIAVDDVHVYWADQGAGAILRAKKAGGTAEIVARSLARPWGVAVDGAAVYFTTQGPDDTSNGAVMKIAKPL